MSGNNSYPADELLDNSPDPVLTLDLPDRSGIEVLEEIRRRNGGSEVFILTNHTAPGFRERCLRAGANHFLNKSKDFEKMAKLLRQPRLLPKRKSEKTGKKE